MINKKNKSLIIIIPARLKSERLSEKLLRKINRLPMIVRVANAANKTNLGEILVATDSEKIKKVCNENGIKSIITSSNIKSGTDRVFEAYKTIGKEYDLIVNLQGDLPIFNSELIKSIVKLFSDKEAEIGSAITELDESEINDRNIVKAKVKLDRNNQGFAIDFCRSIKNKKNFYHHIGVYVYTPNSLKKFVKLQQTSNEVKRSLEQMRAMDNKIKIKLVKVDSNPLSVDTKEDLRKIRLLFKENKY